MLGCDRECELRPLLPRNQGKVVDIWEKSAVRLTLQCGTEIQAALNWMHEWPSRAVKPRHHTQRCLPTQPMAGWFARPTPCSGRRLGSRRCWRRRRRGPSWQPSALEVWRVEAVHPAAYRIFTNACRRCHCTAGAHSLFIYSVEGQRLCQVPPEFGGGPGSTTAAAADGGEAVHVAAQTPAGEAAPGTEGAAAASAGGSTMGVADSSPGAENEPAAGDQAAEAAGGTTDAASTGSPGAAAPAAGKKQGQSEAGAAGQPHTAPVPSTQKERPLDLRASTGPLSAAGQGCPTVYFLRRGRATVALPLEGIESELSYGLLPAGPSIGSLQQLLAAVALPWLAAQQESAASSGQHGAVSWHPSGGRHSRLDDLAAATQKFVGQVEQAVKQLGAEVELPLPQGVDLTNPRAAAASEESVLVCERCMVEWVRVMTATLQREGQMQPQGRGPLAELHHWQRRSAAYNSLHEQLSLPVIHAAVEVVQHGSLDQSLLASFKTQASDLARLTLEAQDNVKFLLTLERHFNAIASGSLEAVVDALLPMMNAIRMVSGQEAGTWHAGGWGPETDCFGGGGWDVWLYLITACSLAASSPLPPLVLVT